MNREDGSDLLAFLAAAERRNVRHTSTADASLDGPAQARCMTILNAPSASAQKELDQRNADGAASPRDKTQRTSPMSKTGVGSQG